MIYNEAFIGIKEIISSWLMKHGRHPNARYKAVLLAGEAVQKLAYMSLPLLQHRIITRKPGQTWFELPADLNAVVSIGIRTGDSWKPVGYSRTLMPMPATSGANDADLDPNSFTGQFLNTWGNQQTWFDLPASKKGQFQGSSFASSHFAVNSTTGPTPQNYWDYYLRGLHARLDNVVVDLAHRQILTSMKFPCDEIYLCYMGGLQSLNTMTQLPLFAQPAIEAYIDWKWAKNRRNGIRESQGEDLYWNREHKILRALVNQLDTTEIKHILTEYWKLRFDDRYGMSGNIVDGSTPGGGISATGTVESVSVPTNPYPGLLTVDNNIYTHFGVIVNPTADFQVDAHQHPPGQYLIVRWKDTNSDKTKWDEWGTLNLNIPIPGIQFPNKFKARGWWYIVSRNATFNAAPTARLNFHN